MWSCHRCTRVGLTAPVRSGRSSKRSVTSRSTVPGVRCTSRARTGTEVSCSAASGRAWKTSRPASQQHGHRRAARASGRRRRGGRRARARGPRATRVRGGRRRSPDRREPAARGGRARLPPVGSCRAAYAATARSRPARLAAYMRASASRASPSRSAASGAVTTPRLAVMRSPGAIAPHGSSRSARAHALAARERLRVVGARHQQHELLAAGAGDDVVARAPARAAARRRARARGRRPRARSGR